MTKKDRFLGLLLCVLFGLIGGAISNLMLNSRTVAAREVSTVVRAQHFEVINENGKVVGDLGADGSGKSTHLYLAFYSKNTEGQAPLEVPLSSLESDGLLITNDKQSAAMFFGLVSPDGVEQPEPSISARDLHGHTTRLVGKKPRL